MTSATGSGPLSDIGMRVKDLPLLPQLNGLFR